MNEVVGPHLYGISAGKVESPWDVREYDRLMSQAETRAGMTAGTLKLIPWIENAKAVVRAYEIAAASPRVVGVAFGAEDFADDMEIQRTDQGDEVYFPRAYVGTAAKAAEVLALDSPYVNFRDSDGLKADAATALKLGFKGKFAIHPSQIDIITETFSPSLDDDRVCPQGARSVAGGGGCGPWLHVSGRQDGRRAHSETGAKYPRSCRQDVESVTRREHAYSNHQRRSGTASGKDPWLRARKRGACAPRGRRHYGRPEEPGWRRGQGVLAIDGGRQGGSNPEDDGDAEGMGANAIIAVRFTTSMVASGAAEILAYGTAVVVEE